MPAGETAEATERFRDRRPTKSVPGSGVDLYSNWLVKLGLKHIGLLFGNCHLAKSFSCGVCQKIRKGAQGGLGIERCSFKAHSSSRSFWLLN